MLRAPLPRRVSVVATTTALALAADLAPTASVPATVAQGTITPHVYQFSFTPTQYGPAFLAEPQGIAAAADGSVYVVDRFNRRVQHFGPDGTVLNMWGSGGSAPGQFSAPIDVALAADGAVLVLDHDLERVNRRVQTFAPDGTYRSSWPISSYIALGIAVGPDGSVYVADDFGVTHYSAAGAQLGEWDTSSPGVDFLTGWEDIAVAPDGTVIVADDEDERILRYGADGTPKGVWRIPKNSSGQIRRISLAVDPSGDVWLADDQSTMLSRFTVDGQARATIDVGAKSHGIAVSPDGTLAVVAAEGGTIRRLTPAGIEIATWGGLDPGRVSVVSPESVAFAPDGSWFLVDGDRKAVYHFNADGLLMGRLGAPTPETSVISEPYDVAVAPDGTTYVTDCNAPGVLRFDATGATLDPWLDVPGLGELSCPIGIAVAADRSLWVADNGRQEVLHLGADGRLIGRWKAGDWEQGIAEGPVGVAIGPDGTVYVTDQANDRILRFDAAGRPLSTWPMPIDGVAGVDVGPDGTVYATFTFGKRLAAFNPDGVLRIAWQTNAQAIDHRFSVPIGITVAPDGRLFVPDRTTGEVEVFGADYASNWRATYFANRWLAGRPAAVTKVDDVGGVRDLSLDWGDTTPAPGLPADAFSARLTRHARFDEGAWRFAVRAEGGVRLWVDDRLAVDAFGAPDVDAAADLWLGAGGHNLRLEFNDPAGPASLTLAWTPGNAPPPTATPTATATRTPGPTPTGQATATAGRVHGRPWCYMPVAFRR
ncbi:MAG: PA14 domain-containing protein [Ardenticatenales bacterium]